MLRGWRGWWGRASGVETGPAEMRLGAAAGRAVPQGGRTSAHGGSQFAAEFSGEDHLLLAGEADGRGGVVGERCALKGDGQFAGGGEFGGLQAPSAETAQGARA